MAVEKWHADERDDAARLGRDALERVARGAHEAGPQQQVLRRVTRDRELGEDDEVGSGRPRLLDPGEDQFAVPVEVSDGGIDLREGESHSSFSLTVENLATREDRLRRSRAKVSVR